MKDFKENHDATSMIFSLYIPDVLITATIFSVDVNWKECWEKREAGKTFITFVECTLMMSAGVIIGKKYMKEQVGIVKWCVVVAINKLSVRFVRWCVLVIRSRMIMFSSLVPCHKVTRVSLHFPTWLHCSYIVMHRKKYGSPGKTSSSWCAQIWDKKYVWRKETKNENDE